MKRDYLEKIQVSEGVEAEVDGKVVRVKADGLENERQFDGNVNIRKEGNEIILEAKKGTKREKKMLKTMRAHIKNMVKGMKDKFVYKLQICSVHFPISIVIEGKNLLIKNFLGERSPRKLKLKDGVDVKVEGEFIIVESHNKELAGQTAGDIEKIAMIRKMDRRIFQDGIFIVSKAEEAEE